MELIMASPESSLTMAAGGISDSSGARLRERYGFGILEAVAETLAELREEFRREMTELRAAVEKSSSAPLRPSERWNTVDDAVTKMSRSRKTILKYIERGYLRASRPHKDAPWAISDQAIDECMKGLNSSDGPRECASSPPSAEERALLIVSRREQNKERK